MEQKKKVLFVATVVKTHINTFHLPFLKMFKEHGWEVHVAAKNDFIDEPFAIPNCDQYFDIDFVRSPFSQRNIVAYKQLKQIIKTNHYDVIHCHTPVAGVLTRLAARNVKDTTVIYTVHGFHFYKGAPLLNWLIYYPIERFCVKFTDKLITINQEDYTSAKSWSLRNNGKVYYVPGVGVDIEKIHNISIDKEQKKNELGIPNGVKVLLSVGELNENKNHEIIIKTLSKLDDKDFIYLICGKGKLKEHLQNLAKELGIGDKVKFLGYRTDVLEICKIADLFIFPSKREGLPVSLIEAMACGVPCIASDVRGNRDLLYSEKLFNIDDANNLKNIIERNIKLTKQRHLSKMFYQNLKKYSVKTVLNQMEKIYGEL